MTLLKSSFLLLSIFIISCCTSTKTATTSENSNNVEVESKKMMEEGFKKGVIVTSTVEGDCPYTIKLIDDENYPYFLDPINITEEFKKDGEKVWLKFNGLKMMNRCDKANPISIEVIKKRLE